MLKAAGQSSSACPRERGADLLNSLQTGVCKAPPEISQSSKAEYKPKDFQLKNLSA